MRVHSLVVKLKRRFLLLDSSKEGCTKMHGIVRSVIAISIAAQDVDVFMVQGQAEYRTWQIKPTCKQYIVVSLNAVNIDDCILKDGLEYQKLELLQLENSKISEFALQSMLKGMKLMVLSFIHTSFSELSTSIRVLRYLRTLSLDDCTLGDLSSIGKFENLEILSFARTDIKVLPREVADL
ncbi:hypothetical protein PRUPE_3G130200 [Prunus persica]|uniref:NB-ARC domain-containing protein n=1 Tax=Prunus persica TaxID=3760 RepID=M5VSZ9_PRUPE|nr:hypothetical protein PRUPE_3G130200 [Prunus persica]